MTDPKKLAANRRHEALHRAERRADGRRKRWSEQNRDKVRDGYARHRKTNREAINLAKRLKCSISWARYLIDNNQVPPRKRGKE